MKPIILNTNYCSNPRKIRSARGLAFIMHAVRMNRIFSKNDVHELLVRFNLMFPDCNLRRNVFNDGILFTFLISDTIQNYDLKDLVDNLGLEINESIYLVHRTEFLENIAQNRAESILSGLISFGCTLNPLPENGKTKVINKRIESEAVGIVDEKRINDSEAIARGIIDSIHNEEFDKLEKRTANRTAQIEKEWLDVPMIKFNSRKIPKEIKSRIYSHVADKFGMKDEDGNPDLQAIQESKDLIYLIWLWANGFVEEGEVSWVNEHFENDFDYDKSIFQDSDGIGPNLNEVRQFLELDQFFPYFKII